MPMMIFLISFYNFAEALDSPVPTALATTLDTVTSSGSNVRIRSSSSSAPAAKGAYNGDNAAE